MFTKDVLDSYKHHYFYNHSSENYLNFGDSHLVISHFGDVNVPTAYMAHGHDGLLIWTNRL